MKKVFFLLTIGASGFPYFGMGQCAFKAERVKQRHDQYSQSSKDNADKSKKEMDQQADEFNKKKYQATVRSNRGVAQKRKTALRYY